ncbi:MAG: hypothetical protein QW331_03600 [Candidatus Woesearchaeota archaeon]
MKLSLCMVAKNEEKNNVKKLRSLIEKDDADGLSLIRGVYTTNPTEKNFVSSKEDDYNESAEYAG